MDLLEALKRSRAESKESLVSPSPPPHGVASSSSENDGSSGWMGGGTMPPLDYNDLSRPPPLPRRPVMISRKSSGVESKRVNSLTQTMSATTLSACPPDGEKPSRTPSPEKKGRLLRTLRPGREGKPATSKMPSSLRSRPEASKAATQAWGVKTASSFGRPGLGAPRTSATTSNNQSRSPLEMPFPGAESERPSTGSSPDSHPKQPPFYFRAGEGASSMAYAAPTLGSGSDPDVHKPPVAERAAPPRIPQKSVEAGRLQAAQMPSYRKEYPANVQDPRLLAQSAAARSYCDYGTDKHGSSREANTPRKLAPLSQPANNNSRARNMKIQESSEPVALEEDGETTKPRPPPHRKGRARGDSMRADLPSAPTPSTTDSDQEAEECDEWKRRTDEIMKNLPRGVDKQAAQQILNEIVIHGDEVHWDDVAGLEIAKSALKETVVYPFLRPDLFMGLREPARGMLLFGPPGTGKTMLARAVATESKSTFFAISASSLTSKFLGESEKLVRALFQLAKLLAPSIIFVDEIDSLLSSRSGSSEHEATRRIKTEFLIQWSDLQKAAAGREMSEREKEKGDATRVLVLAATNMPWAIDEAARRRFVRRQYIPLPEDWVRKQQLKRLLSHQKHELSESDMDRLVVLTEGMFVLKHPQLLPLPRTMPSFL